MTHASLHPYPSCRRLAVALLAFGLAACETTHYTFRPPATDAGRICTTQCGANREHCRGNEMQRAQRERATCERSADHAFQSCMAQPVPKEREGDKARDCEKKRRSCWSYEDTERCDSDYRQCFVNCGGLVEERTE